MKPITCPFESLEVCLANHVRDWSEDHRDAWIWGIVNGWDEESLAELRIKHGWSDASVKRLRKMHHRFQILKELSGQ